MYLKPVLSDYRAFPLGNGQYGVEHTNRWTQANGRKGSSKFVYSTRFDDKAQAEQFITGKVS